MTLLVVLGSMVVFGAQDIPSALVQLRAMIVYDGAADPTAALYWNETRWVLLAAVLFAAPLWPWAEKKLPRNAPGQIIRALVYAALLLICVSYLAMGAHNPFIYFNF